MAASFHLQSLHGRLQHKSQFLGHTNFATSTAKSSPALLHKPSFKIIVPTAKFNISEILGGRGLCNGEEGIQRELKKTVTKESSSSSSAEPSTASSSEQKAAEAPLEISEEGFEKELLGLTGGFPGGEKGLRKFIEENPPPPKKEETETKGNANYVGVDAKKPKAPELPLLLPGMIAIVKNRNNPFYMYCGIVQRITDGKAGVLFEGGNWDRLVTFRLEELERREKGPPMTNPRSVILEEMMEINKNS